MNGDTCSDRGRGRGSRRRAGVLAVTAGLVLVTAACSGSPSPADPGGSSQAGGSSKYQKAVAYSQCMRSHGVPDFPDPVVNPYGVITFSRPGNIVGSQARLQAAENTCQHLFPSGSQPSQAQQQQQLSNELKFAKCMRSHGMPNWPDPTKIGDEYEFNLNTNIDTNSPQVRTCQSQLHLSPSQVHLPV